MCCNYYYVFFILLLWDEENLRNNFKPFFVDICINRALQDYSTAKWTKLYLIQFFYPLLMINFTMINCLWFYLGSYSSPISYLLELRGTSKSLYWSFSSSTHTFKDPYIHRFTFTLIVSLSLCIYASMQKVRCWVSETRLSKACAYINYYKSSFTWCNILQITYKWYCVGNSILNEWSTSYPYKKLNSLSLSPQHFILMEGSTVYPWCLNILSSNKAQLYTIECSTFYL